MISPASNHPSLALALLSYAAGPQCPHLTPAIRIAEGASAQDPQFLHAIEAGLTPFMYYAMRACPERVPPAWRDALRSADLTAQVRSENHCQTASEVIDVCQGVGVRPTLLKGISISHQHYPAPHLRPMGDIDILVPELDFDRVESALIRNGMVRQADRVRPAGSHHGIPLYHPQQDVWIEVHSALFPQSSDLNSGTLFGSAQIVAHSIPTSFQGRPVYRLTDELQLAYIASSWIRDLSRNQMHPSFLLPLLDAVYLLRAAGTSLDWGRLLSDLDDGELATASLYVMLTYLSRHGLATCEPSTLAQIASRQRIIGSWERKLIASLLDTYLLRGKPFGRLLGGWTMQNALITALGRGSHFRKLCELPWNVVFPPTLPERYSVGFHARRIARVLRDHGREDNQR